jgi:predicted branched-subunit amino acid permease
VQSRPLQPRRPVGGFCAGVGGAITTRRSSWLGAVRDGGISVVPLLFGVVPFGLIFGVAAASSVVGGGVGYATSIIIFGGAAQLATIDLFNAGAAGPVIVATGLIINSRHLMYSAALAPAFSAFSRPWRLGLPYLLTDQAFAVSIVRYEEQSDIGYRRLFYLGAGLALWVTWQLTTGVGVIFGTAIPATWSLDFAIPLVFVALLIPTLKDRPALIAAVVAAGAAVAAASVPYHLGLMIGALCGVVAGVVAERGASAPSHDVGDVQGEVGALPARTQDEGASGRCVEDEDAAGGVPDRPERGNRCESGH